MYLMLALLPSTAAALEATLPVVASLGYGGGAAGGPCSGPLLSETGQFLSFACLSADLVANDGNNRSDTFLVDRVSGLTERVSVDSGGSEYFYDSFSGVPSTDGRWVVFGSYAPLHPDLSFPYLQFGFYNPFLRDRLGGTTELLARDVHGGYPSQSRSAVAYGVSFGERLVLLSTESNLLTSAPPPVPRPYHLYLRNWETGALELVTATPSGEFSRSGATTAALSPDGRRVAFLSSGDDLGPANPSGTEQLMVRDRQTGTTRRLSYTASGGEFAGTPYYQLNAGVFSGDGKLLAFAADSDELSGNGAPARMDTYVVDTDSGQYELISTGHGGASPDNASFSPSISRDGRYVAFASRASNLLMTPQLPGVYVKDRWTGELINISASLGAPGHQEISNVSVSGDGSTVAFDWRFPDNFPVLGGRTLIYTVQLRGTPIASPVAVPTLGRMTTGLLIGLLVLVSCAASERQCRA
jgi:Tol biopolymer transport system component